MTTTPDQAAELFRALGTLVINFSALEESLHDAIWVTADQQIDVRTVNTLTAGLTFRTLVEKWGALCKHADGLRATEEELEAFCSTLVALADERNTYIHSAWNFRDPADLPIRLKRSAKPKTGFSMKVARVPIADIAALAQKLVEAEQRLWELTP